MDSEGQISSLLEQLQELNFYVLYCQGKKHTNAEAFSQLL